MRTFVYGKRNIKELFSDPVNLIFTIGLPVFFAFIHGDFQQ